MTPDDAQYLTQAQVARRCAVSREVVRFWMDKRMIHVALFPGRKKNVIKRIKIDSLVEFENKYGDKPPTPRGSRSRKGVRK